MPKIESNEFEARNAMRSARLVIWILAWVGTMILVDKAVLYGWLSSIYMLRAGIVINAALGLGVILSFLRYLREMDEMQRKIQTESLALGMGVALVGSFSYSLLTTAGIVTDPEVSDITLLMCLTYMGSVIVGQYRYR
jgi:hypothetical protein